jgi:hypothetical protein
MMDLPNENDAHRHGPHRPQHPHQPYQLHHPRPHQRPDLGPSSAPPRFAIVLGSGGVRSMAALGLVEVLAREGLMPDAVVGCSAGAMFGALIAAGHRAEEAVRIATSLWSPEVTRQRRWRAIPQMLWPKLTNFNADFSLRCDTLVMQRLQQAFGNVHIEDLPLKLRITAADMATGERVVLSRGPLVQALRASVALPFMFAPVCSRRRASGGVARLCITHAAAFGRPLAPAGPSDFGDDQQLGASAAGRSAGSGPSQRPAFVVHRTGVGAPRGLV